MSRIQKKFIKFGTGASEVNSRDIPANYTPTNYTPSQVAAEGNDKTSAHLKGIDEALANIGASYTATIANNISSAQNVTSALFNPASIRGVEIDFNIYRSTNTNEVASTGTIYLAYLATAATWAISYDSTSSNGGVIFDITDVGQLTYTSTNISGTGYAGNMKFTIKSFSA